MTRKPLQGAVHVTQILHSLIGKLTRHTVAWRVHGTYAQVRKLRQLQNQNVLLNHLATKYEILPEDANLSVEIVREFLTAGHLFENVMPSSWPCHLHDKK